MKKILFISTLFFSALSFAGFDGFLTIEGKLMEKDRCDMKVKQSNGKTVLLPLKEFKQYLNSSGQLSAKLHISKFRVALGMGMKAKMGTDIGGGSNTRGTDIGGGSNTRGTDIGGGSNTRSCHLRKNLSLRERKLKVKGTSNFAFTD